MKKAHYHTLEYELVEKLAADRFTGRSVLDLGCGLGDYLRLFSKYGCDVAGVDINPRQVDALKTQGFQTWLPAELPQDSKYDLLFSSHVIEHMVPAEMIAYFRQWLPYMKPDGRLLVITPMAGHRFWHDFTHIRPYYPQSLWMLWGGWERPASDRLEWTLELEDIHFFNDPYRIRQGAIFGRSYYTKATGEKGPMPLATRVINSGLEYAWRLSKGKIGACASWLGIYKFG